jgi:2-C-methyl-D-erythritol 4-phosphate cytidylyltransferase
MASNNGSPRCWAVVPAAGVGKRMLADRPKQYLLLNNCTVLEQTLQRLWDSAIFQKVVVAVSAEDEYWPGLAIAKQPWVLRADGGKERADSVLSGLLALQELAAADDWVFVHDAARPCLTSKDVLLLLSTLQNDAVGGILAQPMHDTLKRSEHTRIADTVNRDHIWRALTPQMFRYATLTKALQSAAANGVVVTDEASAIEASGLQPMLVEGRSDNIKITRPEDLALAQFYLEQQ